MRQDRKKTPLRELTTYGDSRAVRHPDCDYSGEIDVHLTICADRGEPFRDEALARVVCESVEFYRNREIHVTADRARPTWDDKAVARVLNAEFRQVVFCFALAMCASLCGCGAVFVPRVQCFPDPVRLIVVNDAETEHPLDSAQVTYWIEPYCNWFEQAGPWIASENTDLDRMGDTAELVAVTDQGDGEFTVKWCRKTGWVQWFFPIPSPLGWNLYREHQAVVLAEASGYYPLKISYLPHTTYNGDSTPNCAGDAKGHFNLDQKGTLTIGVFRIPGANNR